MPPLKPEVAVVNGRIWHFVGATYVQYTAAEAGNVIKKLQQAKAQLLADEKRAKRALKKALRAETS